MEGYWGMGQTIASHEITQQAGVGGGGGNGGAGRRGKNAEDEMFKSLGHRIEAKLSELLRRTETLLTENRLEVLSVAHTLESHKTITGEDVLAIIHGRKGPFIDGRRYRTESFRHLAESYHDAVLAAHKARVPVQIPLPELPVLPPGDAPETEEVLAFPT